MELRAPYLPSPEDPPASVAPEYRPPARFVDYWDWARIQDDRDGVKTGRLAPWLREAAQTLDPMAILRRAVVARFRPRTADAAAESQALADLAVTGRVAFTRFRSMRPRDELLLSAVRTELSSIDPSALGATVREVLDRAYNVAWALRGSPTQRRDLRPGLGWIAVSSEDDSPHAPTNVSCTTDHMGELALSVGRSAQVVTLRASIKLPMEPATVPLPPIAERRVPAPTDLIDALFLRRSTAGYDELFLFVHGLGSRLEESETFKRNLIDLGLARGRRYAVLSVDMPGMGYSSRLDIDNLITRRVRGHHGFNLPNGVGSNFPLLGLYRDTLVEICNRFRVQYVMGGSLGGNMTLWLAAEPMFTDLDPSRGQPSSVMSFLSWSPASIWESYERSRDTPVEGNGTHMDIGKNGAKKTSMGRMSERETEGRRWEFFEKMQRGEEILGLHILGAWGYPPTQDGLLLQSELYNEQYRRTFWTAAYEQVTFSHQEPLTPSGRWPFQTIAKPLFLAGGARDVGDHGVMDIYNPVIAVSDRVRGVLGRRQLMLETEHGISDQRPRHLAEQIVDFIGSLNSRWGHLSPDTAHPFHADVNCDLGLATPTAFGVKAVIAADVDGDGRAELIVQPDLPGTGGNDLWVMKYDPSRRAWAHLSPMAGHPFGADVNCDLGLATPTAFGVKAVIAADVDGDRQAELIIAPDVGGTGGNDLWVMKYDRSRRAWAHLSPDITHPFHADVNCDLGQPTPTGYGVKAMVAADVDGDGRAELIVAPDVGGTAGNDLWVMKYDPARRSWAHLSPIPEHLPYLTDVNCDMGLARPTGFGVKTILAGDVDGDRQAELIVVPDIGGTAGNDLWVMKYDPARRSWAHLRNEAHFPYPPSDVDVNCDLGLTTPTAFGVKVVISADVDGDRQAELIVAPDTGGTGGNDLWVMTYDR